MKILLTVEELAKYLKIKPDTIYKKVRKGELPAIKLGKLVRFPKELIDEWIIEQAARTMKKTVEEVQAAKDRVESRVEEAMSEVKKTARAASRVMGEVPEFIEDVKNAPFNKKQETLTKGLKALWTDFNKKVAKVQSKVSARKRTSKKQPKTLGKPTSRTSKQRSAPQPL